jgi:hypothetical protein
MRKILFSGTALVGMAMGGAVAAAPVVATLQHAPVTASVQRVQDYDHHDEHHAKGRYYYNHRYWEHRRWDEHHHHWDYY